MPPGFSLNLLMLEGEKTILLNVVCIQNSLTNAYEVHIKEIAVSAEKTIRTSVPVFQKQEPVTSPQWVIDGPLLFSVKA